MGRKPAASHVGTPSCISHVAAVCLRVWRDTLDPRSFASGIKSLFDVADRLAVDVQHRPQVAAPSAGSSQVW